MRRILVVCLLAAVSAGAATAEDVEARRAELWAKVDAVEANEEGLTEAERLQALIDISFDQTMLEHPEFGTMIGYPTGHDRWTDDSAEAHERREQESIRSLEVIKSLDRSELEGEDRLNYDLIMENLVDGVEGQRFKGEYMPISQMGGVQQNIARMLAMMPTASVEQYENILSRLSKTGERVEWTMSWLEKGLEVGITPPRITLRDVPEQVKNQLVDDPMQSPMLRAFTRFPADMPEEEQERLRQAAIDAFNEVVTPAYRSLYEYLVETYIPASRESIAMKDLPDGPEWYAFNVRQMTTTDMTPQEIHDLGQSEVKRIRAEMDRVIEESGFEGSFEEFTEFLRTDAQFYFDEADALLASYRDISKRADAQLVKLFGTLPRLPYGVEPVPSYAEKSQTTTYYERGSKEAGRPGTFFANSTT